MLRAWWRGTHRRMRASEPGTGTGWTAARCAAAGARATVGPLHPETPREAHKHNLNSQTDTRRMTQTQYTKDTTTSGCCSGAEPPGAGAEHPHREEAPRERPPAGNRHAASVAVPRGPRPNEGHGSAWGARSAGCWRSVLLQLRRSSQGVELSGFRTS